MADEAAAEQVDAAAVQQAASTSGRDEVALDVRLPDEVHVNHSKAWSGRQAAFVSLMHGELPTFCQHSLHQPACIDLIPSDTLRGTQSADCQAAHASSIAESV